MDRDPIDDAASLVRQRFPHARWAVLSGSVLTPARTAGSDLDIVVMLSGAEESGAPFRESLRWRDWPVELFVHTGPSLDHYCAGDLARRQPTLHRMVAGGALLVGDADEFALVRDECATVLSAGPPPLPPRELEAARYGLTDLVDDLVHSTDPGETAAVAAAAWLAAAQLACDCARHWRGTGKWVVRELRHLDAAFADRWLEARADPRAVAELARQVLAQAGGALFEGYRASGTVPSQAEASR
jgi:hypothetical protein